MLAACAALSLSACEDFQAESTRKEIYKIAFRTSQFQEALDRRNLDHALPVQPGDRNDAPADDLLAKAARGMFDFG